MYKFKTIAQVDDISILKSINDAGEVCSVSIDQEDQEIYMTPDQFIALINAIKDVDI